MHVRSILSAAAIAATAIAPSAASAATVAVATADLNIRSGPGPEYPVIGYIALNGEATIEACAQGSRWCQITYRGRQGWAYTQYMQPLTRTVTERRTTTTVVEPRTATTVVEPPPVVVAEPPAVVTVPAPAVVTAPRTTIVAEPAQTFNVPTVVYERPATVGSAIEATGNIIDSVANTAVAATQAIVPPPAVRTYVVEHPVDPIYLNGEVVVGASLPESVDLRPVPNYDYRYIYVNRQPVLVEPSTRRIVYVYR